MQTLVIYYSRNGFTEKALSILADFLKDPTDTIHIKDMNNEVDLNKYDRIIIGSPVYNNRVNSKILGFCKKNMEILSEKKLGFFVTSLSDIETAKDYLFQSFPKSLLRSTRCKSFFGGEISWASLSPVERLTLQMTKGITTDVSNIDLNEIEKFAACLRKQCR
ncbi:flavodoxin domain-containing protein [Spirochaeta cellobiosiphila]|uniref:flavodoxin domain-containing protein n=1 Tax=Spirochaeta cellobiosiphila TaxID=504483 RepID=UPI0004904CCC|nr:flavodoxin domain-containing protein [Spirochaeta cellobiosiphila]